MNITKKHLLNILFIILIGLLFYPPTRIYFIRFISFSPSIEKTEKREKLVNYNWNLKGLNTENINFNEIKNKVILVNFWATWCPPCIAELPSMQKLYRDYKDQIVFLFVTNENKETINTFLKKKNMYIPVYNPLNNRPKLFENRTIPITFLIDKQGYIIIKKKGAADWNSKKIRKLLDNLTKQK